MREEPTGEQIKGVKMQIEAGNPPYTDFSVFGPDGKAFQTRLRFNAFVCTAPGKYEMQLLPGPSSFTSWRKSFRVLRVVLLTLKVCRPECLDSYEEHIRAFAERFPKYWG